MKAQREHGGKYGLNIRLSQVKNYVVLKAKFQNFPSLFRLLVLRLYNSYANDERSDNLETSFLH